jgi:hypothetical protein
LENEGWCWDGLELEYLLVERLLEELLDSWDLLRISLD